MPKSLKRRDRLPPGERLRRPCVARSDRAWRSSHHALELGQDIVERGQPALGIGEVDPGQRRSDLDRASLHGCVAPRPLDVAIGPRLEGRSMGEVGKYLYLTTVGWGQGGA